ncbi:MAG: hypothetical protein GX130_04950 [Candidatus Hydrogenedens sp.]|nr:hypothetical protein [Candidatus Hydrogenedens sp.]
MSEEKHSPDIWDSLSFIVWCLLFLMGLFPEMVFLQTRELAGVVTKGAFTNTPLFITIAGAAFLGGFTYNRSRLLGDNDEYALLKTLHMILMSFIAFAPIHVEQLPLYLSIPVPFYRRLLVTVVATKIFVWIILLAFLLRYHMFRGLPAFQKMPLISWVKLFTSYSDEKAGEDVKKERPESTDKTEALSPEEKAAKDREATQPGE